MSCYCFREAAALSCLPPYLFLPMKGCVFYSFEAGLGISSGSWRQLDPLPQPLEFYAAKNPTNSLTE